MGKRRYSRRKSVERREAFKGIFYLLVAISLGIGMLFWGIPTVIKLVGGMFVDSQTTISTGEVSYLSIPRIDVLPEATNSADLKISGYSEPGIDIILYVNNLEKEKSVSDKDGQFIFNVLLNQGENFIYVKAQRGKVVRESEKYRVIFDNQPPKIEITSPQDGSEFRGNDKQVVAIKGNVDEEVVEIKAGERLAIIGNDKTWEIDYPLQEGEQDIVIEAKDKAGNVGKTSLHLTWYKQ